MWTPTAHPSVHSPPINDCCVNRSKLTTKDCVVLGNEKKAEKSYCPSYANTWYRYPTQQNTTDTNYLMILLLHNSVRSVLIHGCWLGYSVRILPMYSCQSSCQSQRWIALV